ncbi:beta-ketoacyl synthase N-terminal-like domain-containing protein [Mycolicibacterium obuense]|uniref:3-oxoacyl-[acyl-carrier-protein] synthase 2 n=1 Tax=Mycolicibacterium obuense TaxID=1807 RepID=A0A0J6WD84_9MYCO|nr:beta-ketoacyl synthase N-terminal-like domain-containing protein [Mycolicibacterium obuense]KMO80489.1 3-oxoacyl-[acyl-carrier-protein] synthase 2 [Mycolicibacterium obuense]
MSTTHMGIAGIGAVTGYGWGRKALWNGLASGKPAATLYPGFGPGENDDAWLARVPDEGDPRDGLTRFAQAMRAAAREAITDARQRGWTPGPRVGLLHAVVIAEVEGWRAFYLEDHANRRIRDYLALMPSTPVSMLMQEYGFHGPAMNVSAMCASGNAALITAKMWLDTGMVDDVVFVSTDLSLTPENVEHFVRLGVGVVDTDPLDACRPFQHGSRGFPAGEAAVSFVLSRRSDAPYVRVLGGAMTHDAFHLTSVDPSRTEVDRCVLDALASSGVGASDIAYLNAHGPGTQQCDTVEAAVLDEVLGGAAQIYSVKPLTGHCQGAAAAVEVAAAALGYAEEQVPAPPTVAPGHPRLLDGLTPMLSGLTLKTSLGMGGHNAAVVLAPAE